MVEPTWEALRLRDLFRRRDDLMVWMIDHELMTMTAVAKYFGISKQRVQQIHSREKGKDV